MSFGNQKSAIENVYKGTSTQLQTEKFYSTSGTAPWKTNAYMYDANGQITTYTYDAFNQLTKETLPDGQVINYTYDTVGNRTAKAVIKNGVTITSNYTFNDANQMTNAGAQAYTIDFNGNLTNDGRYQYTWNAFDQLTGVKGETDTTYTYDENGRRVYSKVGSIETYYRYDGTSNHVLFEENASGAVVAEYTYDAWGNILTQTDSIISKENPYRYAGYRYDEETKLYYLMARYYNPDTGVFLSLDPVRGDTLNPITMNGYNYANNNPVMFVDPDGEWAVVIGAVVGALINAIIYYVGLINKHGFKNAL